MNDIITIQLRFFVSTAIGTYSDVISFTESEWAKRDQNVIDAQKQQLAGIWVTFRSAQIADEDALKTVEGKQAKIVQIDAQIADLVAAKAALT